MKLYWLFWLLLAVILYWAWQPILTCIVLLVFLMGGLVNVIIGIMLMLLLIVALSN